MEGRPQPRQTSSSWHKRRRRSRRRRSRRRRSRRRRARGGRGGARGGGAGKPAPRETMAVETAPAETLPAPAASPSEIPANPVTTADLNLRAGPSLADPVLTVIPAGAALAPTGEWSQGFVGVTYEGNYGWVDSGWVAAGEPEADTAPPPATKDVALLQ